MENKKSRYLQDAGKILWLTIKLTVVLYAVFQATNVTILYQGF